MGQTTTTNVLCIELVPQLLYRMAESFSGVRFVQASSHQESYVMPMRDAEVLLTSNGFFTAESCAVIRERAPHLRWIQFTTSGIDKGLKHGLPDHLMITTAAGVHTSSVSEHAIALMLALVRRLDEASTAQHNRHWRRKELFRQISTLDGANLLIIGVGAIGSEIGNKAKAFGMRVSGVSRSARTAPGFNSIWPRDRLAAALSLADIVVVAANYDSDTHHLLNAKMLASLKPSAFLINVARGALIDETALGDCLRHGRIAGAAIDVMEEEPLAMDSPFWTLPNLILTPHVAGAGGDKVDKLFKVIAGNMSRYLAGEKLANTIRRS